MDLQYVVSQTIYNAKQNKQPNSIQL